LNELKIFKNEAFGEIRTIKVNSEPWFVAKDVAEVLGYSNPRKAIGDHVDNEDKGVTKCDTLGGSQELTVINESGLYSLILSSKLPNAKAFKKWVTSEVLPSIRKHGLYATDELLDNPDLIIQMASKLKEEREAREVLEAENDIMKPKALFADAVSASHTSILVGDLAKLLRQNGIDIGAHRLFEKLREKGFLMKSGSSKNMPTQSSMDRGLFEIKEGSYINSDGVNVVTKTTKVTGKGQVYFVNLFLNA
jgi:prophage antirepressor